MSRTFRIIEGSPGAGRSQHILSEVLQRLQSEEIDPHSVLILSPRSADSRLLSARFDRMALDKGTWYPVRFDTLQGIAREILAKDPEFAYHRPMDDTEERLVLETVLQQVLSGEETSGQSNIYRQAVALRSLGFIDDVHAFVAELKQHRIAPVQGHPGSSATYGEFIATLPQQDALRALGRAYETYQEILRTDQRYDAQGVLWNAYVAAQDKRFLDRFPPYRLVYYDDAQDISALEAELLVSILHPETELAVSHCPLTAAFRFRYALRAPITSINSLLTKRDGDSPESTTVNLDAVDPSESPARPLSVTAVGLRVENRTEPATDFWVCGDVQTERETVAAEIIRLLQEGAQTPIEIAIITRTRAEAQEFSVLLGGLGIPVDDATDGTGTALILLNHLLTFLENGLDLLRTGRAEHPGSSLERSLLALVSLTPDGAEMTSQIMEKAEELREENIPLIQPNAECDGLSLAVDIAGLSKPFEGLNEALRRCRQGTPTSQTLAYLLASFSIHNVLTEPHRSSIMRVLGRVLQRIADSEQTVDRLGGRIGPRAIRRRLRALVGHGTQPEDRGGIAILPAHETRGREWPVVFLPRLNEHSFPADTQISALFRNATAQQLKAKAEKLDRERGLGGGAFSFAGFAEDPGDAKAEEDRLFVLAVTRATERLVLSWSDREGDRDIAPSKYAREAVGRRLNANPHDIDWVSSTEAFRRIPAEESYWYPPTRQTGLAISVSDKSPTFDSVRIEHSPSSLSTYWLCPRKYFYQNALRLEQEISDYQIYGQMVHSVLRTLMLQPPDSLDTDAVFDRTDIQGITAKHRTQFSSETAFSFFFDRFVSSLHDFFEKRPDLFEKPVYCVGAIPVIERKLTRIETIHDRNITLVGKIDLAFEDEPGSLRIVDFKTGQPVSEVGLRRAMVFRENEPKSPIMPDRDYQLPLYKYLLNPQEDTLLSHFYLRPAYREGFKERTVAVSSTADNTILTEEELSGCIREALELAVSIEEASEFPREPKNQACRKFQTECPFIFLCDGMEGD